MNSKYKWAIIGLSLLLLGVVYYQRFYSLQQKDPFVKDHPLFKKIPGGDFTLTGHKGPISLKDFRGKIVILYFGFTSCPDVCPTSLSYLAKVYRRLSAHHRSKVQVLFITLDPARDSAEKINRYVHFFSKSFQGLTGTKETIAKLAKQYGVFYKRTPLKNSALNYTIDHSSRFYFIDSQGKLSETFADQEKKEVLLSSLHKLIERNE